MSFSILIVTVRATHYCMNDVVFMWLLMSLWSGYRFIGFAWDKELAATMSMETMAESINGLHGASDNVCVVVTSGAHFGEGTTSPSSQEIAGNKLRPPMAAPGDGPPSGYANRRTRECAMAYSPGINGLFLASLVVYLSILMSDYGLQLQAHQPAEAEAGSLLFSSLCADFRRKIPSPVSRSLRLRLAHNVVKKHWSRYP